MPADYSRIHRLLKILTLIQAQPGWSAGRLAEECGVTVRTIFRDMEMLEGAGIPYFFDDESKGYRVRGDFFMRPVELTLDESLALIALGEHIGGDDQVPFTRAAARAVAKIRGQLPPALRQELASLDQRVKIRLGPAGGSEGIADVYERVRAAIARRCALRCRYESASGRGSRGPEAAGDGVFLFRPYTLFFAQRAWYVVGHHSQRDALRCLKLGRFSLVESTRQRYTIPDTFQFDEYLGNAWRMIRGPRRFAVEVRFDPEFADTIADTHWHRTQEVEWNDDGSITFRCQVDGLDEIVWWVLSMGPHCRVVQPPELATKVRELAQQTAAAYAGGGQAQPPTS